MKGFSIQIVLKDCIPEISLHIKKLKLEIVDCIGSLVHARYHTKLQSSSGLILTDVLLYMKKTGK